MNPEPIEWICAVCRCPIIDEAGFVEVRYADCRRYAVELRDWKSANPGPVIEGAALLTYPKRAPWLAFHWVCDPEPNGESYWIAVERIGTAAEFIDWMGHLSEKRWFAHTDWPSLCHRVAGQLTADQAGDGAR